MSRFESGASDVKFCGTGHLGWHLLDKQDQTSSILVFRTIRLDWQVALRSLIRSAAEFESRQPDQINDIGGYENETQAKETKVM